jgi:U3 small nucleolar RNA-associated protein 10
MVSSGYLDKLLSISNISAEADLDDEVDDSRVQCLRLAARQIDAKSLFAALEKNWDEAAAAGTLVNVFMLCDFTFLTCLGTS